MPQGANVEPLLLIIEGFLEYWCCSIGGSLSGVHCLEDGFCLNANLDLLFVLDTNHGFLQVDEVLLPRRRSSA